MEAIVRSGAAEVAMLADASPEALSAASDVVPAAARADSLDALLEEPLDGLVIATPSAQHAEQATRALERGIAVFCQKPLARTADECRTVIAAARSADRLLGVDFSYRLTSGMQAIHELVQREALGRIFAVDLVFHNAYGPDKAWFYDPQRSGGGCVMDLGIHLVDLALWTLDFPRVTDVWSRLYVKGELLRAPVACVEDYAVAELLLDGDIAVRLTCSWRLSAGRDAVIEAAFHGTEGGAAMRNVNGSFFDFAAQRFRGTAREPLSAPPDEWGGRAAVAWARRLADGGRYDPAIERAIDVADVLDRIYGR
jgi:predicted dehydrogenase